MSEDRLPKTAKRKIELDRNLQPVRVFHYTNGGTKWTHSAELSERQACVACPEVQTDD